MSWRLRIWCADCYDVDPQGCFDGGYMVSEASWGARDIAERAARAYEPPYRAEPILDARSRAYPWWRHMDPENGLLALARLGQAVAAGLAAEVDEAIGGPWDVRRWQVPNELDEARRAITDGFDPYPWWTAPDGFFDSLTSSPAPSSMTWSTATPEEIIADIQSVAATTLEKMHQLDKPRGPYPTPIVQTASVPLTGTKWTGNDYVDVEVLVWEIAGTWYVHPERWALVQAAIARGHIEVTKGVVDGNTFHVIADYGENV